MYIKLKYIRISLDIYQDVSYHSQNQKKKKERNRRKEHINYENIPNA